jgi:hypothetical protein
MVLFKANILCVLKRCENGVGMLLEWCENDLRMVVGMLLEWCENDLRMVLELCQDGVTIVFKFVLWCCNGRRMV